MMNLKALWDDLTRTRAERDPAPVSPHVRIRAIKGAGARPSRCAACGASGLQHFYTSWRTGEALCATCFQERMADVRCSPEAGPGEAEGAALG